MATIERRLTKGNKVRYRAQIRRRGFPTLSETFARKTDAVEWAETREREMQRGTFVDRREAERHTFGETLDKYVAEVMPRKPKSAAQQIPQCDWWRSKLGDKLLSSVRKTDILALRAELVTRTSASNANRYMSLLSHVFTVAVVEWEWLEASPIKGIKRLPEPRGRVRFLDDNERAALLRECRKSPAKELYPAVLLLLTTGARKNEVMSLKWSNIDFARGTIAIEDSKNKESRSVPLVGPAVNALREWGRIRRLDTPLVFPASRYPNRPAKIDRPFGIALKAAGIEDFSDS